MGNQQERSLAWLAGIVEGEGSISFQIYMLPDKRIRVTPYFAVVNSDMKIIGEVCRIFDVLGVKWRDCNKKRSTVAGGSFAGVKHVACIRVDGQKPCKILAETLYPFMIGEKRKNAKAIVSFLNSRAIRGIERNELGHCRRVEYSMSEIEIICSVRNHKRAKSSEAIRSAPNVVG